MMDGKDTWLHSYGVSYEEILMVVKQGLWLMALCLLIGSMEHQECLSVQGN